MDRGTWTATAFTSRSPRVGGLSCQQGLRRGGSTRIARPDDRRCYDGFGDRYWTVGTVVFPALPSGSSRAYRPDGHGSPGPGRTGCERGRDRHRFDCRPILGQKRRPPPWLEDRRCRRCSGCCRRRPPPGCSSGCAGLCLGSPDRGSDPGGEGIEHSAAVESVDRSITTFVVAHRMSALDQLMKAVTWTGSWIAALGVSAVVVACTWKRRLPISAVVAVLAAWLGELLAVTLTKAVVERARPPEAVRVVVAHGWSFPSGHTANAVVVFAAAAALLTFLVHSRIVRFLAWALAVLATALVGFSRIELGVHWTTDVVMSMVWTTWWIVVLVVVVRRIRTAGSAARDAEAVTDAAVSAAAAPFATDACDGSGTPRPAPLGGDSEATRRSWWVLAIPRLLSTRLGGLRLLWPCGSRPGPGWCPARRGLRNAISGSASSVLANRGFVIDTTALPATHHRGRPCAGRSQPARPRRQRPHPGHHPPRARPSPPPSTARDAAHDVCTVLIRPPSHHHPPRRNHD